MPPATSLAPATFSPSTYDGVLAGAAEIHPIVTLVGRMTELGATLRATPGPAYAYVDRDEVDSTGHDHGPSSPQFAAAAERCLDALDAGLRALAGERSCCWPPTTDSRRRPRHHGLRQRGWPQIVDPLARAGRAPARSRGSARDLFLHCRPGAVDEVVDGLARLLGERATVHRVDDVVAAGWLGTVGERLRARLADVCVLPAPGETVWWRERHRFDMRFRGHHGGLSEDEGLTQVAALVV